MDIIHKSEYNHWREKGVAFEIREGAYDVPNKTLASGLIIKKVRFFMTLQLRVVCNTVYA